MAEVDLGALSREELVAEVRRLRAAERRGGVEAARQDAIFESARDFAMVVTDRDGIITDWTSGAENVMGWTAAEVRGRDASRFFTPEDRAALPRAGRRSDVVPRSGPQSARSACFLL